MTLDAAYHLLYITALIVLSVLIGVMLVRSAIGPRILDRLLSINMIGTMIIASLAIYTLLLDESYLTDVALIYAMVSLLTMLIMASVYLKKRDGTEPTHAGSGAEHRKKHRGRKRKKAESRRGR